MAHEAELDIRPRELSFRVLLMDPHEATPERAVPALRAWLDRKRPGLAAALEIAPAGEAIRFTARGESPEATLRELEDLLGIGRELVPQGEIEVSAERFAIEVAPGADRRPDEREILRSRVRSFPYPVCEWFDINTGMLVLTDRRITYEPEHVPIAERDYPERHIVEIPLKTVTNARRGLWWDVPCLMLETDGLTHRFGWPAERRELATVFDIAEWLETLRELLGRMR
jgi:hypothetical protein